MKFSPSVRLLGIACLVGSGLAAAGPYCPAPDPQIYTLDERPDGNMVVAYSVTMPMATIETGRYATGGSGFGGSSMFGQHHLIRSGNVILVPNAGSNTISSMRLIDGKPVLVDTVTSGGIRPVAISDVRILGEPGFTFGKADAKFLTGAAGAKNEGVGFFYVLNHVGNLIQGFTVDGEGHINRVEGSARLLNCGLLGKGARLSFSLDGTRLVATDQFSDNRSAFYVKSDGTLADHAAHQAVTAKLDAPQAEIVSDSHDKG